MDAEVPSENRPEIAGQPSSAPPTAEKQTIAADSGSRGKPNSGDIAPVVFLYGGGVLFGELMVWGITNIRHEPPLVVMAACIGFLACEISLLAAWIAFARVALPLRILAAVPGAAIIFLPAFASMGREADFLRAIALTAMAVLVAAGPMLVMRACGLELAAQSRFAAQPGDGQRQYKPRQFTLRQMFEWTLAAALVAALVRFLVVRPDADEGRAQLRELPSLLIMCLIQGIIAAAAVWAALGRGQPMPRLIGVTAAAAMVAVAFCGILRAPGDAIAVFLMTAICDSLMTGGGLALLRTVDVRLQRAGRARER